MRVDMLLPRHCIAALFLLALPAIVQAQFIFTTNNGAITITGYDGSGGAVVIPDATNGYPVIGVVDFAFEDATNLTSVTIPGSVTNIGEAPFLGCSSLTNISVNATNPVYLSDNGVLIDWRNYTLIQYPNGLTNETYIIPNGYPGPIGVTNVGPYAFTSSASLTSVTYSSVNGWYVYGIGDFAFSGCAGLTTVAITNTSTVQPSHGAPTSIGTEAFSYCTSLTRVFFITSVTNIEQEAFAFCTNLTAVYFPGNAPPDVGNAFYDDPDAVVYYLPGTTNWGPTFGGAPTAEKTSEFAYQVLNGPYNGSIVITGYHGPGGAVVIPGTINGYTVTIIGNAFANLRTNILTSVVIPNTVTNIGPDAFANCRSLTNILIPDSVTTIGEAAFAGCVSLTSITIPRSVTSIGEFAPGSPFNGCTNLNDISVDPANPAYISLNGVLFDKAQDTLITYPAGLTNSIYSIPNSVTNIALGAFWACNSLTNIVLPTSLTSIGNDAFWACSSLASIIIPSSVSSIGQFAFIDCSNLTSAYFLGNAPPNAQIFVFNFLDPVTVYYLPGTTGWSATFGGAPTALWNPQATAITTTGGQIGFNITGPTNAVIVVEACTNLANPVWLSLSTNTLSGNGTSSFSDPQSANYPNRYYRFSAP